MHAFYCNGLYSHRDRGALRLVTARAIGTPALNGLLGRWETAKELGFSPSMGNDFSSYTGLRSSFTLQARRTPMPATESNKENVSDVVSGFSIAFVGLCRALEQQHNVRPDSIVQAINLEMAEMPSGPVPAEVNTIVTKIANAVSGKPIEVRMAQTTR
jgi:hypothetical protein